MIPKRNEDLVSDNDVAVGFILTSFVFIGAVGIARAIMFIAGV